MLGIVNPERGLHRSRSEIISPVSPRYVSSFTAADSESPQRRCRRSSLPGTLSLTEAYNVMSVDVSFVPFFPTATHILTDIHLIFSFLA